MPGADGGSVWLPIDSKFPGDTYAHLQDAQASGDAQAVENARHALELVLRLAQGRTPAGTKPLTAAQQHDTAVLDALDAAFLSE